MAKQDWTAVANTVGPEFAECAAKHDEGDEFVAHHYDALKEHGLISAAVPEELGGGGASLEDLCGTLRTLAHYCSSTALALSMHTHLVAVTAWRWRTQQAPVEGLLKRVAEEKIVLVSTGARTGWTVRGPPRLPKAATVSRPARSSAAALLQERCS